jgi:hypothetical protein
MSVSLLQLLIRTFNLTQILQVKYGNILVEKKLKTGHFFEQTLFGALATGWYLRVK